MRRDDGNMFVLEAILLAMILLGAAYAVQSLYDEPSENVRPRAGLERVARDALTVLEGLTDGNGTGLLELYLQQALHCAVDETPYADDCDTRRGENISVKLDHYLPHGAGYMIGYGNGVGVREIYRSPLPMGEAVASSRAFVPEWNVSFVATEFSCYPEPPAAVDANATIVPIDKGKLTWARWANLTVAGSEFAGERAFTPNWWNVTIPAASVPVGVAYTNVTANASLDSVTGWTVCGHGGATAALRAALAATPFGPAAPVVPLGQSATFEVDLSPIMAVPGVTIGEVSATVYEPIASQMPVADTWISAGKVDLVGGAQRSATWTPAPYTLYGAHPVLLRVGITIGADQVELRKIALVDVGLTTGHVPFEPTYRAVLQAWLPDWA